MKCALLNQLFWEDTMSLLVLLSDGSQVHNSCSVKEFNAFISLLCPKKSDSRMSTILIISQNENENENECQK